MMMATRIRLDRNAMLIVMLSLFEESAAMMAPTGLTDRARGDAR